MRVGRVGNVGRTGRVGGGEGVDTAGPMVISAVVAANGDDVTIVFNEPVEDVAEDAGTTGLIATWREGMVAAPFLLEYVSGNGTNTIVFVAVDGPIPALIPGADTVLTYNASQSDSDIVDLAGRLLPNFTNIRVVTNNSEQ